MTHKQWLQRKLASLPNERLRRKFIVDLTREEMHNFCKSLRRIQGEGHRIKEIMDKLPADRVLRMPPEFTEDFRAAKQIADEFLKRM
jgi:hypothetical protein